ncbi:hypothetical protein GOARA_050_00280 [Gordonia araii NBRC 100433]|uniref:Phosphoribosyltransferase domain-containing protein n=1 Tax=Gordonia araii NBRC 100433 TaxID=1073574 RepID=G7H291_9ACTN|nr:ComF family protein [Gordonia araii]NNG97505.1 ComF family protein [Gordonia araii NBRC 100433]GAB09966.1 hypothetical protein GOARA_050_00280 [Gordonia araii NBRC 100433]
MGEAARRFAPGSLARALVDLVLPLTCGGCGAPGVPWCGRCDRRISDAPRLVTPRVGVGVPVWALGAYRDPLRSAVIRLKERGRRDLVEPLGAAHARAVVTLARWGEIPDAEHLVLVPAPTRAAAARRRGGDPVEAICRAAAAHLGRSVQVAPALRTAAWVRDSAGLSAGARSANLRGAIRMRPRASAALAVPRRSAVVLVDDVVTTGATAAESIRVLAAHDIDVDAVVVLAAAE